MKGLLLILLLGFAGVSAILPVRHAVAANAGELDSSYADGGKAVFSAGNSRVLMRPGASLLQKDGKLVIAYTSTSKGDSQNSWQVTRLDTNGQPDPDFGSNGTSLPTEAPYFIIPFNMVQRTGGGYLLAGTACKAGTTCANPSGMLGAMNQLRVVALTPSGSIDTSFADQGVYNEDAAGANQVGVVVQSTGKAVVWVNWVDPIFNNVARASWRRLAIDGAVDPTFNTGDLGRVFPLMGWVNMGWINGVVQQPDQKLVVGVGYLGQLARFDRNGALDRDFGYGGSTAQRFNKNATSVPFLVRANGRIVVDALVGYCFDCSATSYLVQNNPDGSEDSTFGAFTKPRGLLKIAGDAFLVANSGSDGGSVTVTLSRLLANGIADTTFGGAGSNGTIEVPIGRTGYFAGIEVQADGKILLIAKADDGIAVLRLIGTPTLEPGSENGIWWNPAESGWGLSVQRNDRGVTFAGWYAYDKLGRPTWYHMPAGQPVAANTVEGDVYSPGGPTFDSAIFDSAAVVLGPSLGRFRIEWKDADTALFTIDVEGVHAVKTIRPYLWNYGEESGLYWNPSESGWGFAEYTGYIRKDSLSSQDFADFAVWFTYDHGRATWFVMPKGDRFSGFDFRTIRGPVFNPSGPPLATVFDPTLVNIGASVGTFEYYQGAFVKNLKYDVRGAKGVRALTPFKF